MLTLLPSLLSQQYNLTGTATQAANLNNHDTDALSEGINNLYTTAARTRGHFTYGTVLSMMVQGLAVNQSDINTDNITEGSTFVSLQIQEQMQEFLLLLVQT